MVPGASPRGPTRALVAWCLLNRLLVRIGLPLLVVFYLTVVAAASGRADGLYVTEQFGVARVGGELGNYFEGGFAAHVGFGAHLQGWAIEAQMDANDLEGRGRFGGVRHGAFAWGAGVRRLFPVSPWLRLYLRGGLEYMEISSTDVSTEGTFGDQYGGHGIDFGGGVMVSGQVPLVGLLFAPLLFTDIGPKVSVGAWFDVGDRLLTLKRDRAADLDGYARSWLLGVSLGGRF